MGYARPADAQDAHVLAPKLRPIDRRECEYIGGKSALDALLKGVTDGVSKAMIADDGTTVIGMFGVAPSFLGGCGAAWMLASDELVKDRSHRRQFLHQTPMWVLWMHTHYDVLFNYILEDNHAAIRWLKWGGFNFTPTSLPGVLMFRRYRDVPTGNTVHHDGSVHRGHAGVSEGPK